MPVQFRYEKLIVSNFRGVPEAEIDLPTGCPLHIVGGNNAGKSTLLEAIAFAFRGGGFHQYDLRPFDFHRPAGAADHNREFTVCVTFGADQESDLPAVQGVGSPQFVHGVAAKGRCGKDGGLSKSFHLLNSELRPITFSTRTGLREAEKGIFAGQEGVGWRPINARHDDIRAYLPDVMLLTPGNIHNSLFVWKTGPLNRLASLLAERFLKDHWEFAYQGAVRQMPDAIGAAHRFLCAAVNEFPFWKAQVKPLLAATISEYIGKQTQIELRPTIQALEEWMQQQLLLAFASDDQGSVTPIESVGQGWRSLIRLAALDVLSQIPGELPNKVVLLFEEPETHLHPHLRRRMRAVLERLATAGWMVVTTTHSPEIVSIAGKQRVLKVLRAGDKVTCSLVDLVASATDALRVQAKIDQRGGGELFFANRVVLCEGADDEFALRTWLEKNDVDLDGRSVSVLGVGGKGNIADYARLMRKLGTPWCAVIDEDRLADGKYKPRAEAEAQAIDAILGNSDLALKWEMDLEHCYDIPRGTANPERPEHKATPDWQQEQIGSRRSEDLSTLYPRLASVVTAVQNWLG